MYTFSIYNAIVLLGEAMAKAKSTDPMKVASAMEGLSFKGFNGDSQIRKTDHQMQQGLWISKWQKVDAKNNYSVENTGLHLRAGQVPRALHREHADLVRHEASGTLTAS
jgi:branched-chain amino acid transport system substrate-binding protein